MHPTRVRYRRQRNEVGWINHLPIHSGCGDVPPWMAHSQGPWDCRWWVIIAILAAVHVNGTQWTTVASVHGDVACPEGPEDGIPDLLDDEDDGRGASELCGEDRDDDAASCPAAPALPKVDKARVDELLARVCADENFPVEEGPCEPQETRHHHAKKSKEPTKPPPAKESEKPEEEEEKEEDIHVLGRISDGTKGKKHAGAEKHPEEEKDASRARLKGKGGARKPFPFKDDPIDPWLKGRGVKVVRSKKKGGCHCTIVNVTKVPCELNHGGYHNVYIFYEDCSGHRKQYQPHRYIEFQKRKWHSFHCSGRRGFRTGLVDWSTNEHVYGKSMEWGCCPNAIVWSEGERWYVPLDRPWSHSDPWEAFWVKGPFSWKKKIPEWPVLDFEAKWPYSAEQPLACDSTYNVSLEPECCCADIPEEDTGATDGMWDWETCGSDMVTGLVEQYPDFNDNWQECREPYSNTNTRCHYSYYVVFKDMCC